MAFRSLFPAGLALLAATAAIAASDAPVPLSAKAQAMLAGRTAGTPVDCVPINQLGTTRIVDSTAIIYKRSSKLWYVNQPENGHCRPLRATSGLLTSMTSGRLCRNDLVRITEPGTVIGMGACGLGPFIPYTKDVTPPAG